MNPILKIDSPDLSVREFILTIVTFIKKVIHVAPTTEQLPCPPPPQQWADSVLPSCVAGQCIARSGDELFAGSRLNRRRSEFAQGRACLHGLLEEMGENKKVGSAEDRSPVWPDGFVGSLSHSDVWIWGCVARQSDLLSIGIDTERVASSTLRQDVQDTVATDSEWSLVRQSGLTPEEAFTLVFSAKEAFYKCWHPLVKTYFDFFDVQVVALTPTTLSLKTLSTHPGFGSGPDVLKVHYSTHQSSVFTAAWMEAGAESWI
jgi:enterobactin synthetase component D